MTKLQAHFQVLETSKSPAQRIMDLDRDLLEELEQSQTPLLHLYEWEKPSVTHGLFTRPEDYLNLSELKAKGIALAKRPTGGGIVFHIADLAFSALVPSVHPAFSKNTLSNYAFINGKVKKALLRFFSEGCQLELCQVEPKEPEACQRFCMAKPTKYDLMIDGQKAAGAAQRTCHFGFLHQGTISLGLLEPEFLSNVLKEGSQVAKSMERYTYAPLGSQWQSRLEEVRLGLRKALIEEFTQE
jgi:lipoate---protein ligase